MLVLTASKCRPRYINDSPLSHSLANVETDTQHALLHYLRDQQAHEKLALKLQSAGEKESIGQGEDKTKETPHNPEARL
jgi:hypothetical protein